MRRENTQPRDVAAGGADLPRGTGRVSFNGANLNLYAAGARGTEAPVSTAAWLLALNARLSVP